MAFLTDISPLTVVLSAGVSVVTGYVGTLLNFRRQRDRARRTYGLAILSEIKSLQRVFRHYHGLLTARPAGVPAARLPRLRLGVADLNVFGFNSGNIGLFSVRTAVEVIELYSRTRALIAQAEALAEVTQPGPPPDLVLSDELLDHIAAVAVARQHSRAVATLLRRELPVLPEERLRYLRRRGRIGLRRIRRRLLDRQQRRPVQAAGPDARSVQASTRSQMEVSR